MEKKQYFQIDSNPPGVTITSPDLNGITTLLIGRFLQTKPDEFKSCTITSLWLTDAEYQALPGRDLVVQ